jgi:hypothetical protein
MWECLLPHAKFYFLTLPFKTLKLRVSSVVLPIFYRCGLVYVGSPLVWIIIIYLFFLVTSLFFLAILLNQQWFSPLRLQASHCSTFRIMCHVPSIAVFCSESIECFPGRASKFFLKLLVNISVAPIITGIIVHFRFHIRCIPLLLLLLLLLLQLSFHSVALVLTAVQIKQQE